MTTAIPIRDRLLDGQAPTTATHSHAVASDGTPRRYSGIEQGRAPTPLRPLPLVCRRCKTRYAPAAIAVCGECLAPLEPEYDADRALPDRATIAARPASLWRYREWLPFTGAPTLSLDTGGTPLVEAPALANLLGVSRAWVKNDSVSHPSLSFKDRVVTTAINAARAFGLDTIGCASTGNLANAVAAHAARAGLPAWIFIPHDLELAKLVATVVCGAHVVRVRGTYDDVNRLCAQIADEYGWGIVNVNLRSYYGEGSKTVAFEIAEQLGWRSPTAVIAPMAGGSLITKLHKGFAEFRAAGLIDGPVPRLYGGQAAGCAPIVRLVESGGDRIVPEVPRTIARSLAIGNPADGAEAARILRDDGGWAAAVSDEALVHGITVLAETTGIFTETAGGATVAAALALADAGRFVPQDEVVLCITGNGLKTVDAVTPTLADAPVIGPRLRELEAIVRTHRAPRRTNRIASTTIATHDYPLRHSDLTMPITLNLPAVLARLSDGQRTITATGATVGDAVSDVSITVPRAPATPRRRGWSAVSVRDLLPQRRGHSPPGRIRRRRRTMAMRWWSSQRSLEADRCRHRCLLSDARFGVGVPAGSARAVPRGDRRATAGTSSCRRSASTASDDSRPPAS